MRRFHPVLPLARRRQRGATSLLISVLIMFLAAVLIIGVSRTTTMEQRMSGNELRARQAFEPRGQQEQIHGVGQIGDVAPPAEQLDALPEPRRRDERLRRRAQRPVARDEEPQARVP